jgi:nucleoside-diphosphate-sugar epimerase
MLSKLCGEALVAYSGVPYTIVRPHNFYGPRMGLSHVVPQLLEKAHRAADGDALEVFSIEHSRTFCYIDDAVEMITRAATSAACEGVTLNIGTQAPEIRIGDLASVILDVVGRRLSILAKPPTPGSPARRCPDMQLTKKLTGYESRVSLKEGVRRTYEWYRDKVFSGRESEVAI